MPEKKTLAQFIRDAKRKHGAKYDYSLVNYVNSATKVRIICKFHGPFDQTPNNHLNGAGCNDCGNPKRTVPLSSNKLLMDHWDQDKNTLDTNDLLCGSNLLAHWRCENGHTWTQRIIDVFNKKGGLCDQCNSFAFKAPELLQFWDFDGNGSMSPSDIAYKSGKELNWKCDIADDHKWVASPYRMVNRKNPCTFCLGKHASSTSNLLIDAPELAYEWDYLKNGDLKPENVTKGSKQKVWWKCPHGHSYRANINNRYSNSAGCKFCSSQSSMPEIRLFTELSAIFSDALWRHKVKSTEIDVFLPSLSVGIEYDGYHWHQDKRQADLNKNKFFGRLGIEIFRIRAAGLFKLSAGDVVTETHEITLTDIKALLLHLVEKVPSLHEKTADYMNRTSFLAEDEFKRIISYLPAPVPENSFAEKYPERAKFWDFTKNFPLTPHNFTPSSSKVVHWKCIVNDKHQWEAPISRLLKHGCPICSGNKIIPENSFAAKHPEIAKTLDTSLSPDIDLWSLAPNSSQEAFWHCDKGHSFETSLTKRRQYGCNICSGKVVIYETSLAHKASAVLPFWDSEQNDKIGLKPEEVTPASSKKAHWRCPHGHVFEKKIADMVKAVSSKSATLGCKYCAKNPKKFGLVKNQWQSK